MWIAATIVATQHDENPFRASGRSRTRLPVAAKIVLQMAAGSRRG